MDEWKQTVAANLIARRKEHHLTQAQLAEQLHYSDKAVSKWERGESLPDLAVMKQLADLYGILIDDFLYPPGQAPERRTEPEPEQEIEHESENEPENIPEPEPEQEAPVPVSKRRVHLVIAGMAVLLVWLIVTMLFVILDSALPELRYGPFLFIFAFPVSAIVWLVFNSIWFNPRRNYLIISVLLWSVLAAIFLSLYHYHIYKLFLIGIPAQLIILLWSRLHPQKKETVKKTEEHDT